MSSFIKKINDIIGVVLLLGGTTSLFIVIVIIGLFRSCIGCNKIDIDNSYMVSRKEYDRAYIADSTGCGYELLWYTTNTVTDLRYEEIKSRKHIKESYTRLKNEAADHFNNNLINTDIYNFVEYAKSFDVDPDVRLVNIWVYGMEYRQLYQRPNKNYPDGWKMEDHREFGILYLLENDIHPYNFEAPRKYRYWKCYVTSLSDERFTHITPYDRRRANH